jgi:O-antigen ligase
MPEQTATRRMDTPHMTARPSPFPLLWDHPRPLPEVNLGAAPRTPGFWMQALMVLGLTINSGAITPALRFAQGASSMAPLEQDPSTTVALTVVMIGMGLYFARHWRALLVHARALFPYAVVLALCLASAAWSQYPLATLRRWCTLTVCLLFGVMCAESAGLDGTIRIYVRLTIVLLILSVLVYFAVPRVGHDTALGYTEGMRGIFAQKNTLGEAALLALAGCCYIVLRQQRDRLKWIMAMVMMIGCIVLAKSATSLGIAMILLGVTAVIYGRRRGLGPLIGYVTISGLLIVAAVVIFDPDLFLALVGRDASLTGRVPLWHMSLRAVAERPWLGYGYATFWNPDSRTARYIWQAIDWEAATAHNGYIDIMLQVGIPGLLAYVWMWGSVIYYAACAARRGNAPEAIWILLYMTMNVLLNMDEGPLPYPDQFSAMMPIAMIFLWHWRRRNLDVRPPRPAAIRFPPARPAPLRPAATGLGAAVGPAE